MARRGQLEWKLPQSVLVLFVGDGLRADKAFQSFPEPYPESQEDLVPRPLAPFLRSRVIGHGTFGVSHTRVPTESRPGHVALIAGHGYRPYSKEYLYNLKIVDEGIKEVTKVIEDFYHDGKTAFVFTADHGMSDWGSHGDGHPDNTRTPLIAWGSGVAKPVVQAHGIAPGHDELSSDWGMNHIHRHDVSQADVAALMAYLVGLDFPVNSVGELPLSYLAADIPQKAEAFLANARGILDMYRIKEEHKKATELRYQPFAGLGDDNHTAEHRLADIRSLIDRGQHEEAIRETAELVRLGLAGLRYLQTYDWLFLRALITMGYLGWITFALTTVIDLHVLHGNSKTSRTLASSLFFSSILVALFASFIVSESPLTYYAYAVFPVAFWEEVYARRNALAEGGKLLFGHVKSPLAYIGIFLKTAIFLGLIESLAWGYTHREIFSVLFIGATFWPAFYGLEFLKKNKALTLTWIASCVGMSTFTLLPAMKIENIDLILYGGALMVAMAGDSIAPANNLLSRSLIGAQIGLIVLSMIVTRSTAMSLQARMGLPRGNQIVGWCLIVASLIMPFLHRLQPNNHYLHRLMIIFLTFAPLFYARISLFFLILLQSAFFSTGNMASVSSFSLDSVNRLIPVFDPFSQGALLIVKLMIPFALISANLGILNKRLGVAPSALFMVVIAISDFLTLHFFWVVKDEGSWLEIGSTISHFIIASLLCLFVASLEGVSELFIAGVEVEDNSSQHEKERELGGVIREEKLTNGSNKVKASVNEKST
ncbi:hypothetical protein EYC84_011295 [Monilinia fructicola]|uniref:GPI ethanolamine phosphate transferase 1 n=1 Tax=Monilinia fructicola TaxID=38448 RepID=A0A5M9J5P3_MONFR|nr:hypothetical protein EYC84_011295 [Monilinia fructicola]